MTTVKQLIVDLGTAPTGRIDFDCTPIRIHNMSEHMSAEFIETVAKHLVKLGYKKLEE